MVDNYEYDDVPIPYPQQGANAPQGQPQQAVPQPYQQFQPQDYAQQPYQQPYDQGQYAQQQNGQHSQPTGQQYYAPQDYQQPAQQYQYQAPPYQPPQYQPYQPYQQQPTQEPTPQPQYQQPQPEAMLNLSGLAVAGLVLGIIAIAGAFVPIVNNFSFFIGLVGLVLSIVGLVRINKGKSRGRGLAVAGIVSGVVSVVVVLAVQAACVAMINSASTNYSRSPGSAATSSSSSSSASAAASSSSAQSAYEVAIVEAAAVSDYEGKPAITVTFSWQNNSDKTASFATTFRPKCFQNGVQLENAIVLDGADGNYLTDVKPGSGTTVQLSYLLTDSSPVEVEVYGMFDYSGDPLDSMTFTVA